MPNRILKESICTSDEIETLSAFQETFFYRLIVNCDDYGRMDARPKILASKLFPLKDIRAAQIEDALRALTSAELVILYEVDGKPFLQMKTWDRHQQVRAKKSKYPHPDEGICNHLISDDSKCPRNSIQSESESNPNPNPNPTPAERKAAFDRFWALYPRHEAKQNAQKAFDKINPDADLLNVICAAVEQWKKSEQWTKDGGQFVPHPATWLNQHRWEDEIPKPAPQGQVKRVQEQAYEQRQNNENQMSDTPEWFREYQQQLTAGE